MKAKVKNIDIETLTDAEQENIDSLGSECKDALEERNFGKYKKLQKALSRFKTESGDIVYAYDFYEQLHFMILLVDTYYRRDNEKPFSEGKLVSLVKNALKYAPDELDVNFSNCFWMVFHPNWLILSETRFKIMDECLKHYPKTNEYEWSKILANAASCEFKYSQSNQEIINELVERGANINIALLEALKKGNTHSIMVLNSLGAKIKPELISDDMKLSKADFESKLKEAKEKFNEEFLSLIRDDETYNPYTIARYINLGADVNYCSEKHHRKLVPLFEAIRGEKEAIFDLLLKSGANPNIKVGSISALQKTIDFKNIRMAKKLLKNGADPTDVVIDDSKVEKN